ncbi:type II 3-dehydroquinate dehydratase [Chrysiogenes arsenatis]|uniref:type II 3-dehydroquinate dehydratase n=1 Tax=Chrysiogenes arsenatis TaxID=309797 RepID=UPI000418B183|nr:type II 3-dehydroquinate dehydratase [Chrysiogenes arsenatis]
MLHITLINGPNLNMLGVREPEKYGTQTLNEIETIVRHDTEQRGGTLHALQSNHEGVLIDAIHAARTVSAGIIINPGGFTHTSVALRDALLSVSIPFVEVHLSNVYAREPFRHHSYLSDIAMAVMSGAGARGYLYAVDLLFHKLTSSTP